MGHLDGRVVFVTGAGRGVGRAHALLLAEEGAQVVVNDLGGAQDGSGVDAGPAQQVVDEIVAAGGQAVANGDSVTDADGVQRMIRTAVETFGDLHCVVSNAGILRDRMLVSMSEEDFDTVIDVHVKGTWLVMHHAANHWRSRSKAGTQVRASIVNTTSTSGLHSNVGQSNYGPAKSAIATMSIIAAQELSRYGVRVNALAPAARSRLTESTPGLSERMKVAEGDFDIWDPANISPLVAWLCMEDCPATAQVYWSFGNKIARYLEWTKADVAEVKDRRWEIDEIADVAGRWETSHVPTRLMKVEETSLLGNPAGG